MEEEKAAALYDELTRKGEGAARYKQGLGFSSASNKDDAVPSRGSALPTFTSSSSFLSSFVKASSPSKTAELEKQAQLESIHSKLKKKQPQNLTPSPVATGVSTRDRDRDRDGHSSRRSRDRDRHSRSRSRSGSRDDYRRRRGYRSRSRSRCREREREGSWSSRRRRRSSRSESPLPRERKLDKNSSEKVEKERKGRVNYAELIEGYEKMTPAEKVKAKMKLQLSETAEKDETKGMGSGWERFDFDKDAPLDDEEIEAVDDDAALVKHIGKSFRFATVEARRDEEIKAAHDEAMFGASSLLPATTETDEEEESENIKKKAHESATVTNLLSDQVLTMQQGSWRDRVRKL